MLLHDGILKTLDAVKNNQVFQLDPNHFGERSDLAQVSDSRGCQDVERKNEAIVANVQR